MNHYSHPYVCVCVRACTCVHVRARVCTCVHVCAHPIYAGVLRGLHVYFFLLLVMNIILLDV